jgi:hypothetical protein
MKRIVTILLLSTFSIVLNAQVDGVGVNTTDPKSTLDINGNLSVKHLTLTGSGIATIIDDGVYISINPTASNQEFRLPNATEFPGRIYILRNITNGLDAIISTAGTDPTPGVGVEFFAGDNSTTGTKTVTLAGANVTTKTLIFISDGSNWTYGHLGF